MKLKPHFKLFPLLHLSISPAVPWEDYIALCLVIVLFICFLYFGYRDDYRRDRKGFIKTVIAVSLFFLSAYYGLIVYLGFGKKVLKKKDKDKAKAEQAAKTK